jgi:hypothetical protein
MPPLLLFAILNRLSKETGLKETDLNRVAKSGSFAFLAGWNRQWAGEC